MGYTQAIDTLESVLFLFDNPNNTELVGIRNIIQIESESYVFDIQFTDLDSTGTTKWGFRWSPPEIPIKYFDLISWNASFYNDPLVSASADTCKLFLLGDFNDDNQVNGFDLEEFRKEFGKIGVINMEEDMNGDGRVDGRDLNEFQKYFGRRWTPICSY